MFADIQKFPADHKVGLSGGEQDRIIDCCSLFSTTTDILFLLLDMVCCYVVEVSYRKMLQTCHFKNKCFFCFYYSKNLTLLVILQGAAHVGGGAEKSQRVMSAAL